MCGMGFSNTGGVDFGLVTHSGHWSSINWKKIDSRAHLNDIEQEVFVSKDGVRRLLPQIRVMCIKSGKNGHTNHGRRASLHVAFDLPWCNVAHSYLASSLSARPSKETGSESSPHAHPRPTGHLETC